MVGSSQKLIASGYYPQSSHSSLVGSADVYGAFILLFHLHIHNQKLITKGIRLIKTRLETLWVLAIIPSLTKSTRMAMQPTRRGYSLLRALECYINNMGRKRSGSCFIIRGSLVGSLLKTYHQRARASRCAEHYSKRSPFSNTTIPLLKLLALTNRTNFYSLAV